MFEIALILLCRQSSSAPGLSIKIHSFKKNEKDGTSVTSAVSLQSPTLNTKHSKDGSNRSKLFRPICRNPSPQLAFSDKKKNKSISRKRIAVFWTEFGSSSRRCRHTKMINFSTFQVATGTSTSKRCNKSNNKTK